MKVITTQPNGPPIVEVTVPQATLGKMQAEIDRLRSQLDVVCTTYNSVALTATRLRRTLRKLVTDGLTRAEANTVLADTAPPDLAELPIEPHVTIPRAELDRLRAALTDIKQTMKGFDDWDLDDPISKIVENLYGILAKTAPPDAGG